METQYAPHKFAAIFPSMTDDEITDLVADIKKNGLVEPIVLYEGSVLDGVHRQEACLKAGVRTRYIEFDRLPSASQARGPLSYVMSKNLRRRHLTQSQRAMIAAELANIKWGGDRKSDQAANRRSPDQAANKCYYPVTQSRAAKIMQVSERSVRAAKKVMRQTPALVPEIAAGKLTLGKATGEDAKVAARRAGLEAAIARIEKVCGNVLADAVRERIRLKTPKDVLAFAGMDDGEMKRLQILIEDGWRLTRARLYKAKKLTNGSELAVLCHNAALNGGSLTVDIDPWRITVTRLKIHALI